jgi:hypothetical protein
MSATIPLTENTPPIELEVRDFSHHAENCSHEPCPARLNPAHLVLTDVRNGLHCRGPQLVKKIVVPRFLVAQNGDQKLWHSVLLGVELRSVKRELVWGI